MTYIKPAVLQALNTVLVTNFQGAWAGAPIWWNKVASRVPSSRRSNTYAAIARIPRMREWLGARLLNNLEAYAYQLVNRTYEDTVEVSRDDIEDDEIGGVILAAQMLGHAGAKWPDQLTQDALAANGAGFDGLAYFHDAHTIDPATTQDNNFALTLNAANYQTVREAMMAYTGEDSEPLGVMPGLLVVPPQLEGEARLILNADIIASAAGTASETNIWKGSADLLVVPELAGAATTWYLFDVSKPIKPLIWQVRRDVVLTAKTNLDDENVFNQNTFQWGIDGRGAVGYGPWFLAARSVG